MLELMINYIQTIPWYWVLLFACFITFLENIFPPSPSDALLIFMGALVTSGSIGFVPLLIASTIGSTLGFMAMFWLGEKFEVRVIESNRIKFISRTAIERVELWFQRWGYWMIVANRFLSGTRAVIAFFAGMSSLSLRKSAVLSFFSALLWNSILIYLGYLFGDNWKAVDKYMTLYGYILGPSVVVIILGYFAFKFIQNKRAKRRENV